MFLVFLLVGRGTRGGAELYFCVPKLDGFSQSGLLIRSDVSFLNFERFVLEFVILAGQSCQISTRL